MPYAPRPEDPDDGVWQNWTIATREQHLISEYAGISIPEALALDIIDYMILRRDAVATALTRTKDGREYLGEAWCRLQTEPDREALRELIQGGVAVGK